MHEAHERLAFHGEQFQARMLAPDVALRTRNQSTIQEFAKRRFDQQLVSFGSTSNTKS